MAAAGNAVVPKFGSWDAENIGYTVFFEKVRDNKPAPAPATATAPPKPPTSANNHGGGGGYDFDPYEHYENLSRKVPSRPPSSHGGGHAPAPAPKAPGGGYDYDPYEYYENLGRKVPSRPPSSHGGHAPAPGGAYDDYDRYEHYDNLSSRNVPSRPPSSHGHGHARTGYDYDPYEHYENLSSRNVPSRPPSSHGHGGHAPAPPQTHHRPQHHHQQPQPQQHSGGGGGHGYHHRRTGSNGSNAASETSSRGSKFSPPRPYQPRYSSNTNGHPTQPQAAGHVAAHANAHYQQQQNHGAARAERASPSPSPPRHHQPPPPPPRRANKPSAVPRFGVWDEQNAAMAAQGFTVQFEKVKRHREEARTAPAQPPVQRPQQQQVPPHDYHAAGYGKRTKPKTKRSFMSKVYRCMFPRVRE